MEFQPFLQTHPVYCLLFLLLFFFFNFSYTTFIFHRTLIFKSFQFDLNIVKNLVFFFTMNLPLFLKKKNVQRNILIKHSLLIFVERRERD
jgi:hypothetical protein